jgi:hypothetical protein
MDSNIEDRQTAGVEIRSLVSIRASGRANSWSGLLASRTVEVHTSCGFQPLCWQPFAKAVTENQHISSLWSFLTSGYKSAPVLRSISPSWLVFLTALRAIWKYSCPCLSMGTCSKTPSECLKPWIVSNLMQPTFNATHACLW